jgi:hypothetical protein
LISKAFPLLKVAQIDEHSSWTTLDIVLKVQLVHLMMPSVLRQCNVVDRMSNECETVILGENLAECHFVDDNVTKLYKYDCK